MNGYLVIAIIGVVAGIILYGVYKKEKNGPDIVDDMRRNYDDVLDKTVDVDNPTSGGMSAGGQEVESIDDL